MIFHILKSISYLKETGHFYNMILNTPLKHIEIALGTSLVVQWFENTPSNVRDGGFNPQSGN